MRPAAIVATNSETAAIAKSLTRDIPVIFGSRQDPIRMGLVESLAHPGGNLTGFTYFVPIEEKRLELLRQLSPRVRKLGILVDRWWMDESEGSSVMEGGARQGFEPHVFFAETTQALQMTLATAAARQMDAWYVPYTVLPFDRPAELVAMLGATRKPVIYPATQFVERGGLISYQQLLPLEESSRLIANMVALVLDGVPAGEIPIERPKSFELAINLATAKGLGISVPRSLIKRADRVIGAENAE
jgi:putative ABC transport system substrate-binding protein